MSPNNSPGSHLSYSQMSQLTKNGVSRSLVIFGISILIGLTMASLADTQWAANIREQALAEASLKNRTPPALWKIYLMSITKAFVMMVAPMIAVLVLRKLYRRAVGASHN